MTVTVNTSGAGERLVSIADAKTRLNLSTDAYDSLLGQLIDEASDAIRSYLDRTSLGYQVYTEKAVARGGSYLRLANAPIKTTTVSVVHFPDGSTVGSTISTGWVAYPDEGMLYASTFWSNTARYRGDIVYHRAALTEGRDFSVTYGAGYDLSGPTTNSTLASIGGYELPFAFRRAALVTVEFWFRDLPVAQSSTTFRLVRTNDFEIQSELFGRGSDQAKINRGIIPDDARRLMDPYRLEW